MQDIAESVRAEIAAPEELAHLDGTVDRSQRDWYKDAIIYQLHIKAFQDGNNDGMGDFRGLLERLDYIESLGVTAIWILPFYPSPLRDDGYDISEYRAVNPSYGSIEDFQAFVAEAHRRGIRVITELVINHTSDQHPWFQAARQAPPGSPERDFYVWSDSDDRYRGTRIIFIDTEKSNWTWDPVAQAYFWHRFYSHQPDLNFDNPRVLEEVLSVMGMWLDMGVDGLRLDAIPYLVEREGTNNENLPETHDILKRIRIALDDRYTDRMLLAEANQWPEDTRPYFGEGDECHMAFHFPLMPRMYMALAQEDRHPITDIIRQTPEIPEQCQWAIFLRNHDELTLEMVTDEERDYLWQTYAADARARINLGIRRRLAPLLQNDRRKIELMNAFLMSMPGTPVVYYGDEIGMGDNYYLGDRDGVRTPMQWSADRNAGFSRVAPQQLFLPVIMDPVYGFQSINVEAQQSEPSSLLNWMRRLIQVRKQHKAMGRGSMTFIYPRNRKVIAYLREYEDQTILIVANLSRAAQAVELDLSTWRGRIPVELLGRAAFPPIGDLPYLLTLPAFGFFWFLLADASEATRPRWHDPVPEPLPDFVTVTSRNGSIMSAIEGRDGRTLERETLPQYLPLQRWFGAKDQRITSVAMHPLMESDVFGGALVTLSVQLGSGETQTYFLPMTAHWGGDQLRPGAPKLSYTLAKVRTGPRVGALIDAAQDEHFTAGLVEAMRAGGDHAVSGGFVRFEATDRLREVGELGAPRPVGVEQSNFSIIFSDQLILKMYRRLQVGEQPDVEVGRFLTEVAHYTHTPALFGSITHVPDEGEPTTLAAAFAFVPNQGDAWGAVVEALERYLEDQAINRNVPAERLVEASVSAEEPEPGPRFGFPLDLGELAGRRTAELHRALATETADPAFGTEPITAEDLAAWSSAAVEDANALFRGIDDSRGRMDESLRADADRLLDQRGAIVARLESLRDMAPSGRKVRVHGDYHLGQVLVAQNDLVIIDFEGEPRRTLAERRARTTPLRDVAGMLRSFDYAATMALQRHLEAGHDDEEAPARALAWRDHTVACFLKGYRDAIDGSVVDPGVGPGAQRLLEVMMLQKAIYEVGYEFANRPAWVRIPLESILLTLQS